MIRKEKENCPKDPLLDQYTLIKLKVTQPKYPRYLSSIKSNTLSISSALYVPTELHLHLREGR